MPESFEEFRTSFSYGSRSDLSSKFLKSMSGEEAGDFSQQLLPEVGKAYDTGDLSPCATSPCFPMTRPGRRKRDATTMNTMKSLLEEWDAPMATNSRNGGVAPANRQPRNLTSLSASPRLGGPTH